jgi:hypothetical protein
MSCSIAKHGTKNCSLSRPNPAEMHFEAQHGLFNCEAGVFSGTARFRLIAPGSNPDTTLRRRSFYARLTSPQRREVTYPSSPVCTPTSQHSMPIASGAALPRLLHAKRVVLRMRPVLISSSTVQPGNTYVPRSKWRRTVPDYWVPWTFVPSSIIPSSSK